MTATGIPFSALRTALLTMQAQDRLRDASGT